MRRRISIVRPSRGCTAAMPKGLVLVLLTAHVAAGSPPAEPLPIPLFSFDVASPTVVPPGTPDGIKPDSVLMIDLNGDMPVPVIPGANLGMGREGDDLDSFSFNLADTPQAATFLLLFSVDRATTGDVPPDSDLVDSGVPFNVADQAMRGHAAGDGFVTLALYDRNGVVRSGLRGPTTGNVQGINNYDEGGNDFQAQPATSSRDHVTAPQDGVDAMSQPSPSRAKRQVGFFYTASAESPSLMFPDLPGTSGADIFRVLDPSMPGTVTRFTAAQDLGLSPGDDIDALAIFDENTNGTFDGQDLILFSLAPGSPSLQTPTPIPGISSNGAADIISARLGMLGVPELAVFAAAADLGLIGSNDNVDALHISVCTDATGCARDAGIQLIKGDWTNDASVDINDFPAFVQCLSGPRPAPDFILPPPLCRDVFDFDRDRDVDLGDFAAFQVVFGFVGPATSTSAN